ncbi:MAG: MerR family transcriptional regulator [Methylotenera sp.]|nr:MerR family transcriptional regulator [Methylotenera sp.]
MSEQVNKVQLPPIPAKRYFTIGEVSELCGVKPHVLRYWEQEFTQLKPVKRRGNRRYYQHHEVLLIRRIRELLYEQGFTISGARNRLDNHDTVASESDQAGATQLSGQASVSDGKPVLQSPLSPDAANPQVDFSAIKLELQQILKLLRPEVVLS